MNIQHNTLLILFAIVLVFWIIDKWTENDG